MTPNKVLIVGFGSIGKQHLKVVREVLPLADIRILRRKETFDETEYSSEFIYSISQIKSFQPEIAIISNPAPFHISIAELLAKEGCHLLIEKPLADKTKGLDKFIKSIKKQHIIIQVGYNLRFLASLQELKRNIDNCVLGRVLSVRSEVGQYLPSWRPGKDYRMGVSAQKRLGGGVLLELSHEIDYVRWIFGEVKWVSAWMGRVSDLETDVEDIAHLILGIDNRISENLVITLTMDFFRHDTVRKCNVICKEGTLMWDGIAGNILKNSCWDKEAKFVFKSSENRNDSLKAQFNHFLECIYDENHSYVSIYDGWQTVRIIEAARKSFKKNGKKIKIRELK